MFNTIIAAIALTIATFGGTAAMAGSYTPPPPMECGQQAATPEVTINFKSCPAGYSAKLGAVYLNQGQQVLVDAGNGFVFTESKTIPHKARTTCWVVKKAKLTKNGTAYHMVVNPRDGVMRTGGRFNNNGNRAIIAVPATAGGCDGVSRSATSGAPIQLISQAAFRAGQRK